MQAAVATRFGDPEVLAVTDVPNPTAGDGELLIDVAFVDVLWLDAMQRGGDGAAWGLEPPYVPGNAVVGRVRAVGAGVDPSWAERTVFAHTGGTGGYAEQVAVRAERVGVVPDGLDPRDAAALLHDGGTAVALADATQIAAGRTVLVIGASGGLGIVSIQLAKARGARVVAVARDERKLTRIRELQPDALIDSEAADWVQQARAALDGDGADVILDNIGGTLGEAAFELIAPGGRFSNHGFASGEEAKIDAAAADRLGVSLSGIEAVQMSDDVRRETTARALAEAVAGRVAPIVGQTFPLVQAADAHAAIERREVFGKTLLVP